MSQKEYNIRLYEGQLRKILYLIRKQREELMERYVFYVDVQKHRTLTSYEFSSMNALQHEHRYLEELSYRLLP